MSITYDKLKVESKITIKKLRQVYITSTKNEHAQFILEGYIDESENISEYLSTRVIDTEISLYEKHATIKQQILVFTYKIGKTGIKHAPKYYNEIISGMTLLGEVAKTDGENIWIKLDIDEGQGGEYPYTWRPETGNFMYCMPQVGTRVSLYFPNIDEHSGIAINCVRTNGSDCERMQDPNKKAFVTEHGKEMDLYPEELFFNNEDSAIMISDNLGVILSTEFKINIIGPEINFEAPKIVIKAEIQEINLVYYDMVPKLDASGRVDFVIISILQILNQFDLLGKDGTILEGREFSAFPAFPELLPEEPEKEPFNWFKWGANIALGGLAVVGIGAAFVLTGGAAALAAGSMVASAAVGAAFSVAVTTVVTAVSDVVRGEITDTKDFLVEIGIAAVCGAVGSLFQGGTMLKEGFIGIAEGVIERMLRGEKIFSLSNMLEDFIMSAAVAGLLDVASKKLLNNMPSLKNALSGTKNDILYSCGKITNDTSIDDYFQLENQAEKFYNAIRNDIHDLDVTSIANNTNFKERDILQIKNHVFRSNNILFKDGSRKGFSPDIDIALAWKRLIDGVSIKESDIILLYHELTELKHLQTQVGSYYEKAHEYANINYNWQEIIATIVDPDNLY